MLKAARVSLVSTDRVGGGLVTVIVSGEVAATQAAVEAGAAELLRVPGTVLVSRHVIARPDAELAGIVGRAEPPAPAAPESPAVAAQVPRPDVARLKAMTVDGLRRIASGLPGLPLTPGEIGTARKKTLIDAIMTAYRQEEE
jgi:microcompartment protein CcmL/EutN